MAITVEKSLLNNQSILQDFALVEELDAQSAEIIAGGCCYPRDSEPGCYPREREPGCYPRDREQDCYPRDREQGCYPRDRKYIH